MTEFVLQQNPEVSPKSCFFCGSFEGPFVNTMTYDGPGRIILLCAPQADGRRETGCAGAIVAAIGGLTPKSAESLKRRVTKAERDVAEKDRALEDLRARAIEALT